MITKEEMIAFEQEIADTYCAGKIRAPIHLSDGNEEQLQVIFAKVKPEDWVFSSWRSHYHALLKGIPIERLRAKILAGDSITLMDSEFRFFASAIVGGIVPIAMGTAMGEKRRGTDRHVWCFVGDMTARTGAFHECVTYSANFDLPVTYVIEDNYVSVGTPTPTTWGEPEPEQVTTMPVQIAKNVWQYKYVKHWPHVGAGKWVQF